MNVREQHGGDHVWDLDVPTTGTLATGLEHVDAVSAHLLPSNDAQVMPPSWTPSVPDLGAFEHPGLSALGVNWMSLQFLDDAVWTEMLVSLATDAHPGYQAYANGHVDSNIREQQQQQPQLQTQHPDPETPQSYHRNPAAGHPGVYYVDGDGARAPFGGKYSAAATSNPSSTGSVNSCLCTQAAYENMIRAILAECSRHSNGSRPPTLPTISDMNLYTNAYFDHFHSIFPFLRKSDFPVVAANEWLLLLAVAAVGSRYSRCQQSGFLCNALDSVLQHRKYGFESDTLPSLTTLQAGILNIVLLQYSGIERLMNRAAVDRHYLIEACNSLRLITCPTAAENTARPEDRHETENLRQWLKKESKRRTGMMIWCLDCIFLFEYNKKPLMMLDDVKSLLPSRDDVWEHPELETPDHLSSNVTLLGAMELMYMRKRLPSDLGDFSTAILVNAINRHTRDILHKENNPLSAWTPSAGVQDIAIRTTVSDEDCWFPTTAVALKWRNSGCDSLDLLHWPQNSKAASLSGSEHHVILYLHLSRLIILTPSLHIRTFATKATQCFNTVRISTTLLQWVIQDQCKARLSVIHCGAIYWHARRYSRDSILEPYALYLSTLVLWAFSTAFSEVTEAIATESATVPDPQFLHLDRPVDDELVQTFVRSGYQMVAYMSQVGNIFAPGSPAKVLEVGIALLTSRPRLTAPTRSDNGTVDSTSTNSGSCHTWGVEEMYIALLRDLLMAIENR
ncbi:hypothetical protein ACEQ8H_002263 [Pleosporales sp. CAS-2024a]